MGSTLVEHLTSGRVLLFNSGLARHGSSLHAGVDKILDLHGKIRNLGHELLDGFLLLGVLLGHVFKLHF